MPHEQKSRSFYDLIVVGAGPSGSTSAIEARQRGLSVLLLDKSNFPRDKVCGDGMSKGVGKMLKEMGIPLDSPELRANPIRGVSITGPSGIVREYISNEEVTGEAFTARRQDIDNVLFQKALENGAIFEQAHVKNVFRDEAGKVAGVQVGDKMYEGRVVVDASGATSSIAGKLLESKGRPFTTAIAARAYAKLHTEVPPVLYLQFLPDLVPGYVWLFPLSHNEANIGGGIFDTKAYDPQKLNLKDMLKRFIEDSREQFPMEMDESTFKTWQIPCWTPSMLGNKRAKRVVDGVVLAGDAGGNVDYLTGGGIPYGMETGRLAAHMAEAIKNGTSMDQAVKLFWEGYQSEVRGHLIKTWLAQEVIGKHPAVMTALLRAIPEGKEGAVLKGLAGGHA